MATHLIGKGRPPKHTRFKAGNQEYLKRGKRKKNPEAEIFQKVMAESVAVRRGSRVVRKSRMQMVIDNLFAAALSDNLNAMEMIVSVYTNAKKRIDIAPIIIYCDQDDLDCL